MRNKKLLDIYILEILNRYTSSNKKITIIEIQSYLEKEYDLSVHRNTLSAYISELKYYGYIAGERGVYLVRRFSDIEMKTLMDSVMFSKAIPENDINNIIAKLRHISSPLLRKKYRNIYFVNNIEHTENKNVCEIIGKIDEAIGKRKKIEITSCAYDIEGHLVDRGTKIVDPYYIVLEKSRYYLICYTGRQNDVEPKRIDRISKVKILKEESMDIRKIERYSEYPFDIAEYMREHIYMYSGKSERITLKIKKENIGDVLDWYGKNYKLIDSSEKEAIIKIKANVNAVYFWALQYCNVVEVIGPEYLRDKIKRGLENILLKYKKDLINKS